MLRVFEAFAGYGSQAMALKKYNVPHKIVGVSEIDKYAIQAHEAVHGPVKNYGDISKINGLCLPEMDLFTYSFPCQDISMAGKQRGLKEGTGSRSSLLWECQKIIELKRPKFLMMENVKNLVGKKHKPDFENWLKVLDQLGYNNYWKVINAKFCGIPQNRERVFCVSILKSHDDGSFSFYDDFDNGVRLKNILESEVDEKYYLSEDKTRSLIKALEDKGYNGYNGYKRNYECDGNSYCIDANYHKGTSSGDVGKSRRTHVVERVILTEARSEESKRIRRENMRSGNDYSPRRGKVLKERTDDICNCLTTSITKEHLILEKPVYRFRKLTPTECFILMGVSASDILKIQSAGISNSQMYKMAGNSIVVDCMKFLEKLVYKNRVVVNE